MQSTGGFSLGRMMLLAAGLFTFAAFTNTTLAVGPTVSNVRASQRAGTQLVDVYYDLADPDSSALTVSVAVSTNGGASYTSGAANFTGALAAGITPGSNKKITWNAGADLPAKLFSNVRVSVTATDDSDTTGMALIPYGNFTIGDSLNDTPSPQGNYERPVHAVYVSAFYMDKYEVTLALWNDVYHWATNHGYIFDDYSGFIQHKPNNHPVHSITWYDAVKWCNARSEKVGWTPAYYTDVAQTAVYRGGRVNVENEWVKWQVGYRLPTEAEWEKAARGRASGHRFPWSDTDNISHSRANYRAHYLDPSYDLSKGADYHPTFAPGDGVYPPTSPVGYFAPNGYGLYDMAGNVREWCWNWCCDVYSSDAQTDPRGPTSGTARAWRGGSWDFPAEECRAAYRNGNDPLVNYYYSQGFRCVRSPGDTSPPLLTISSPTNGSSVSTILVTVNGTASDSGRGNSGIVSVTVSGVRADNDTATGSGTANWSRTVTLSPGVNTITVIATDVDSITATTSITVTYNSQDVGGMAPIPAGSFTMGGDANDGAFPLHAVYVSAFYMDKYEVTKSLWDEVYQWATNHNYSFESGAQGKANNHPAHSITWYDAVKWCNARSEKEGRVPAYYTSVEQTNVYRSGQTNVQNDWVKWNAGYRLPTEAEWEKAAQGGVSGHRFPWSDTENIAHSRANYRSLWNGGVPYYMYDVSPSSGYHPTFNDAVFPYTSPVGYFAPNGYGLYDMAGNLWEWCWDWAGAVYSSDSQTDPHGPASGSPRVYRGGSWSVDASACRTAYRDGDGRNPSNSNNGFGFRSVLPPGQ